MASKARRRSAAETSAGLTTTGTTPAPALPASHGDPPSGTQAIGRALSVLRLLTEAGSELGVMTIAQRTGLTPATTHRITRALVAGGLLAQNPGTDGYYLGSGAILLGQAAQRGLGLDKVLSFLEQLNAESGESVNLVVREGGESVVIMRVQSMLPLRFEQYPGARFPLYSTASGKAILSFSDDADAYLRSLPKKLSQLTPCTIRTPGELSHQLREVRDRGYSFDDEENVAGVRCVGAPVLDGAGQAQAAIVVQVPSVRMPVERMHAFGPRLVDIARQVAHFIPPDRTMSRRAH